MEAPRLDRVEDLGDPQFAEVLRIVESVEPPRMDLIDVKRRSFMGERCVLRR
jgi:hypothetical protein